MKKTTCLLGLFLSLFWLPIQVLAYSSEVYLGGESIGIKIETPGVMVIGFYPVNGEYIKGSPEIKIGDLITKINDVEVDSIIALTNAIEKEIKDQKITLTLLRNEKEITSTITLEQVDGIYKTGLYVKDSITGIGTMTYIDPESKIYGALGHEIIESTSSTLVEVKTGIIFESTVTSINKSTTGNAGAKNANFNLNHIYGDIKVNGTHGIYGIYNENSSSSLISVSNPDEIQIGKASIYTVLNGTEKKEYEIEITEIHEYSDVKNITFTITDQDLIDKTGGVIQGMSGSPIVQNGKLIGAVTHVIVDNPLKGYGIFITTMLETGDKIINE